MTSRLAWIVGPILVAAVAVAADEARAQGSGPAAGAAAKAATSALAPGATSALAPGAGAAGAAAAPAQRTLFGFFGLTPDSIHACRDKLCRTQLGLMLNSLATGPVGGVTGGFLPPLCPPALSDAAIAALPGGPEGAQAVAAKIAASEADAKARVAAVEYLGTVDCTHWPEATAALKAALREDPNECVRYAAARVLNSGCCCSKTIIDALKVCVAGEDTDGAPVETSPRVKAAAFSALQNCLSRVPPTLPPETPAVEPIPETKPKPEQGQPDATKPKPETTGAAVEPNPHMPAAHYVSAPRAATYEQRLRHKTFAQTVDEARRTLYEVARNPQQSTAPPPGSQSVFQALARARQTSRPAAPAGRAATPARDPGVQPTSYTPALDGRAASPSLSRPPAVSPDEPRRGLIGSLFKPRSRSAGE